MPNSRRTSAGGAAPEARRDVGPAVGVAVLGGAAHHVQPRVLLRERELQVRVVLVVAQPHVVGRLVALDQVVLERERLHLAVGDDELEVRDLPDQARLVLLGRARRLEVGAHPVAQHAGLADVQHLARGVLEQVDARPARQLRELVVERHGLTVRVSPQRQHRDERRHQQQHAVQRRVARAALRRERHDQRGAREQQRVQDQRDRGAAAAPGLRRAGPARGTLSAAELSTATAATAAADQRSLRSRGCASKKRPAANSARLASTAVSRSMQAHAPARRHAPGLGFQRLVRPRVHDRAV